MILRTTIGKLTHLVTQSVALVVGCALGVAGILGMPSGVSADGEGFAPPHNSDTSALEAAHNAQLAHERQMMDQRSRQMLGGGSIGGGAAQMMQPPPPGAETADGSMKVWDTRGPLELSPSLPKVPAIPEAGASTGPAGAVAGIPGNVIVDLRE